MMMKQTPSILYADLSDPALHQLHYSQQLLIRCIDQEPKSDSTKATTGVTRKMTTQDKMETVNDLTMF